MDNDLERSVRLLEDALQTPTKGLFKLSNQTPKHRESRPDLSLTLGPNSIRELRDADESLLHGTMTILMDGDNTVTGSIIHGGTPWKNAIDNLYTEFADTLQANSGGADMLDIAADLARSCSDVLLAVQTLKSKVTVNEIPEEKWLEKERNNWRLLYVLYQDRVQMQAQQQDEIVPYQGVSEKNCVDVLFKKENLIRESQLVVDWLERNAAEKDDATLQQTDWTYGWEHTLHQLSAPESIAIRSTTTIINNIHPDASHFQNRNLHHLDLANEKTLCQRIFMEIRCGNLEGAQELCYNSGHPWRAALLEGWKLFHNPNLEVTEEKYEDFEKIYEDVEGNSSRDLWKVNAIEYCKNPNLNIYEKAAVASLCGYLEAILPVCNNWEDYLWAYMRTMVDIRVESEIRDTIVRSYMPLPEEYWDQRMSISKIFHVLQVSNNHQISAEAQEIDHIIQKHIILDEILELVNLLAKWSEDSCTSTQQLRFFAHLVLFFDVFGDTGNKKISEKVVEAYISRLSELNSTDLVAFYASKLGKRKQVLLYALHCEKIINNDDRKEALSQAENNDLDVFSITKRIVESICNQPTEIECPGNLPKKLTPVDESKISALDWLTFYDEQRVDALAQTNALVFKFLTLGKLEAAQLAINKIPRNSVESIRNEGDISDDIHQIIKNFLSYKAYLDAHEAFNEWFQQYRNKPALPANLPENAQFTEKVAHSHRVSQHNAELERWKLTTTHAAKTTKTLLYNVLLFPQGWLSGGDEANYLRSVCIPEIVLLLYSVLNESGWHEEAVQLSDLIAAERNGLYKVYSKEKLGEILEKICESSVALLNAKKDPWGNPNTA